MQTSSTWQGATKSITERLGSFARIPVIYYVLLLVLIAIGIRNPNFFQPIPLLAFLKRNAAILLVSMGQTYVILTGELDLSVGALISVCAAVSAKVINNGEGTLLAAYAWVFGIAIAVGLVNGFLTTRFRVPSFVTTLGMWLIAQGTISIITRGADAGGVTQQFRGLGRANIGTSPVPISPVVIIII